MVSSVTEEDITELWAAGYLAKEIAHCLPTEGHVVPTPKPNERVVFIPHFFHGLGFPLHPFVRGLMYYYGIDFHDLSPNTFLNISAFIVMCEAFLRIQPHFGLWLKVFNVKPKVVDGQHAECGGAMVSKLTNVSWPKALSWRLSRNGRNNGSTSQNPAAQTGPQLPNSTPVLQCSSPPGLRRARTGVRQTS